MTSSNEPAERWSYRLGGTAALTISAAYVAVIALYASVGAPPVGGEAWLHYLGGKPTAWWAIVGISVLTNLLYVPVALGLYSVLAAIDRLAMRVGVAFVGLFVTLELAVNWTGYAALLMLSSDYAAAPTESQRTMLVAAASYPSAVLASPLARVYAIGTLSFAFLVIGTVMRKSAFGKLTASVGILTGLSGLVAVAGVTMAVITNAALATVWLLLVGLRLLRLAAHPTAAGGPTVDSSP